VYLTHYNLRIKPFEISPDPKFIWFSEKHKEALAALKYGIQENKGFLLLTGDIGTGKTSLINCFLYENETDAIVATIPDPDLVIIDFFKLLSKELNINTDFNTKGEFLIQFKHFLHITYLEEKKTLLIIDEAQRLNQQLLEQIRLLSNIERHDAKLINIFFVGQRELYKLIMDEQNKALRQRIAVHYSIEPLTESETRNYIKHRLGIAGSGAEIFSPEAIHEIFSFSTGYPRLINIICDRALLTGYVKEINKINGKIVKQCADDLKILVERGDNRNTDLEKPEISAAKPTVSVKKQSKRELRTIEVILVSLIIMAISIYLWLGPEGMSFDFFSKMLKKLKFL
jgi:general secretion pathway protein A